MYLKKINFMPMNLRELYEITGDKSTTVDFLVEHNLIPLRRNCGCGSLQVLQKGEKLI